MKLGDFVNVRTGKLDVNAASVNGKYPFFTCSKEVSKIDNYAFDCECVLLAGNGEINTKYYNGKFNAYQRTYVIESKNKNKLSVKYLYNFFSWYLEELKQHTIGGVIKYIKLGNITEVNIKLPDLKEQEKINRHLDILKSLIASEEKQLSLYDELIKSRFIGQVVRTCN